MTDMANGGSDVAGTSEAESSGATSMDTAPSAETGDRDVIAPAPEGVVEPVDIDLDYDGLPTDTAPPPADIDLDYDTLPTDTATPPADIDLDYDTLPTDTATPPADIDPVGDPRQETARAEIDRAYEVEDARAAVAKSDPHSAASARQDFDAKAESWVATSDRPPGTTDSPDRITERPSAEEQVVIQDARAELTHREEAGETINGFPIERADLWHVQGRNDLGYEGDCALASTAQVLQDAGRPVSENDVVRQAVAEGRCDTQEADAADNGGVRSLGDVRDLLVENGVDADVVHPKDAEQLAGWVEDGHGVLTGVNAGELWDGRYTPDQSAYGYDSSGQARVNHAVVVTGTVRDDLGVLTGFVVNDTGVPDGAAVPVSTETWDRCWTNTDRDHETVVTIAPTRTERSAET